MDADYDPSQQPVCKKRERKRGHEKKKKTKRDAPLMGKKRKKSHFARDHQQKQASLWSQWVLDVYYFF